MMMTSSIVHNKAKKEVQRSSKMKHKDLISKYDFVLSSEKGDKREKWISFQRKLSRKFS